MEKLIVYGSQYGTTKRYAEKFSEMTGVPCLSYENVKTLSGPLCQYSCRLVRWQNEIYNKF